jgi:hypothetical protein
MYRFRRICRGRSAGGSRRGLLGHRWLALPPRAESLSPMRAALSDLASAAAHWMLNRLRDSPPGPASARIEQPKARKSGRHRLEPDLAGISRGIRSFDSGSATA